MAAAASMSVAAAVVVVTLKATDVMISPVRPSASFYFKHNKFIILINPLQWLQCRSAYDTGIVGARDVNP